MTVMNNEDPALPSMPATFTAHTPSGANALLRGARAKARRPDAPAGRACELHEGARRGPVRQLRERSSQGRTQS